MKMGADFIPKISSVVTDDVINDETQYPSISGFYSGKTVALTGGTGFLGQGLTEKLLRCCPDIKKIILFIRNKKNQHPKQRLEALTSLPIFDCLRKMQPNFSEKLSFVECDLEANDLGLCEESVLTLHEEVNVFFHCAATLRFVEHLRISFEINVQCLRRLLRLATGMTQLEAFVHISTAYAHCNQQETNERFYDVGIDYLDLESSLRWMSDDLISKVTPDILGERPNTYTLTKALAEDAVFREGSHLPICIARPSMIIPAYKEPLPGWSTNLYGPSAFFISYAKGILRSAIADADVIADLIPIDFVVNGVICCAMKTACDFTTSSTINEQSLKWTDSIVRHDGDCVCEHNSPRRDQNREIPIYQFTTGGRNPITIERIFDIGVPLYELYPLDPIRVPFVYITTNRRFYQCQIFVRQTCPAMLGDFLLWISNKKTGLLRLNQKIMAGMEVMEFFFTNSFKFGHKRAAQLQACLTNNDQKVYSFDPCSFTWEDQMRSYIRGTREFLVKENMGEYPKARQGLRRAKILNLCFDVIGVLLFFGCTGLASFLWRLIQPIRAAVGIAW